MCQLLPKSKYITPGKAMENVWVIGNDAYDLTSFLTKHPGGEHFVRRSKNRDCTHLVPAYHVNVSRVMKILEKFKIRPTKEGDLDPYLCVPPFVVEGFDLKRDMVHFPSNALQRSVINDVQETKGMVKHLKKLDKVFDMIGVILVGLHFLTLGLFIMDMMPTYLFLFLSVLFRTMISGIGHYGIHKPLPNFSFALFDMNYMGHAFIAVDGHTLMHHVYTQTRGDVKRAFFSLRSIPRGYRFVWHTVHRLCLFLAGVTIRSLVVQYELFSMLTFFNWVKFFVCYWTMRLVLYAEFALCFWYGKIWEWIAQFVITTWWNTFIIVSSHDLENEEPTFHDAKDWGLFQIQHSTDISLVGEPYLDCLLSAGLSPHRVHHLMPFQKSGFSNVACTEIVKRNVEKIGGKWEPPSNFWVQRLPELLYGNFVAGSFKLNDLLYEHLHPTSLWKVCYHILVGIWGQNAI